MDHYKNLFITMIIMAVMTIIIKLFKYLKK